MLDRLIALVSPRRKVELRFRKLQSQGRVSVGAHTYALPRVKTFAGDGTRLEIGSYTSIAGDVEFVLGGNHPVDRLSTFPFRERFELAGVHQDGFPQSRGDIAVGSDVWIGTGTKILSGVKIGHGAVIGACSLVSRDVPPYAIAVGSPAKVVRFRLDDATVKELLSIAWWDWPEDQVVAAVPYLNDQISPAEAIRKLKALASTR